MAADSDPAGPEQVARLPRAFSPAHIARDVVAAELDEIITSRCARKVHSGLLESERWSIDDPERHHRGTCGGKDLEGIIPKECGLVGLALSGGGIRSAAICLGVMQALAEKGCLRFVDYLSTVSGGGYIGSSWSALLARSDDRGAEVKPDFPFIHPAAIGKGQSAYSEHGRHRSHDEPAALCHVRDFANYLIPNGLIDQVRIPVLILRGLLVNALILSPYLLIAAAITLYAVGDHLRAAAAPTAEDIYRPFYTTLAAALCLLVWIVVVPGEAMFRWFGKSTWSTRNRALKFGALPFLLLVLVALAEVQPLLISYLIRHADGLQAKLSNSDLWGVLGLIGGLLSSVFAARSAAAQSALRRRSALLLIGLFGPLAVWLLYYYLCRLAVLENSVDLPFVGEVAIGWQTYVVLAIALWIWSLLVDVNTTSLHNFYRDRLSRTFMVAGGRKSPTDDWSINHVDDVRLSDLCPAKQPAGAPYHLINASLNNPEFRSDLAQRGRRSTFFLFSPRYCGCELLGYCKTENLERIDPHLNLATAMAISGAAAAPNMGQKTFDPLITFLLGMLNVRLGYWLPRPEVVEERWKLPRRVANVTHYDEVTKFRLSVGPIYLFLEMLGLPLLKRAFKHVNVSDGGHIENLGIFELLRRRCRHIIAIDAEADPDMTFNGLATLQRLARIDLDTEIHFDIEDLRKDSAGLSRRPFALCTIDYGRSPDGPGQDQGELLYVKSSLIGTEIEYIKEYRTRYPAFPHESTGDQFFDEAQFEAYRQLGYGIGRQLVDPRDARQERELFATAEQVPESAAAFFQDVRRWLRPAAPFLDAFVKLQDQRLAVERRVAEPGFERYRSELDQLLSPAQPPAAEHASPALQEDLQRFERSGTDGSTPCNDSGRVDPHLLQVVNQQMQLMERAVLELRLDEKANQIHSRNRGWMNLFRAWSQTATFRKYWSLNIAFYSDVLQTFSYEALGLELGIAWHDKIQWPALSAAEKQLLWHVLDPDKAKLCLERPPAGLRLEQLRLATVAPRARWASCPEPLEKTPVALALVEDSGGKKTLRTFRVRDTYRSLRLSELLLVELERREGELDYPFAADDHPAARRLARVAAEVVAQRAPAGQCANSRV